jgi:hypothetical protein
MTRGAQVVACIAAAALLVVASAPAATPLVASPLPVALPENLVAVVSDVPAALGRITKPEFQHALAQRAVTNGLRTLPKPTDSRYEALAKGALDERLESVWVQGQAEAMNIDVNQRQVSIRLGEIKRESFKDGAEYRSFLKEAHYTRRDVRERVEVALLSEAMQLRIERKSQQEINEFVTAFTQRWRALTVCTPDYATDRCSNGPLPGGPHIR